MFKHPYSIVENTKLSDLGLSQENTKLLQLKIQQVAGNEIGIIITLVDLNRIKITVSTSDIEEGLKSIKSVLKNSEVIFELDRSNESILLSKSQFQRLLDIYLPVDRNNEVNLWHEQIKSIDRSNFEQKVSEDLDNSTDKKHRSPLNRSSQDIVSFINKDFFYRGNDIVKLWEQYLKSVDSTLKFYCGIEDNNPITLDTLFNGLTQNREVAVVIKADGRPYQNKNGKTVTLCGEINYEGADTAELDNFIGARIQETIVQIKAYNNEKNHQIKITNHIIIFPYHAGPLHWNLGQIELSFNPTGSTLLKAIIDIYEPFGGRVSRCINLIKSINSLNDFSRVKIKQKDPSEGIRVIQQNDSSSCGAITAENGKEFLKNQDDGNNLLKVVYDHGALQLRKQHIEEIHEDAFFIAQRDNRTYAANGDRPVENRVEIIRLLGNLILKSENDWIKPVMNLINSVDDDISRNNLNLFKEFIIKLDLVRENSNKISDAILKPNGKFREGAMDLIKTLTTNFNSAKDKHSGARKENIEEEQLDVEVANRNLSNLNNCTNANLNEPTNNFSILKTKSSKDLEISTEFLLSLIKKLLPLQVMTELTNIIYQYVNINDYQPANILDQLKYLDNNYYKALLGKLYYKKDLNNLVTLSNIYSELGHLNKFIGDYVIGSRNQLVRNSEELSPLTYYTNSAILFHYVENIYKNFLEPMSIKSDVLGLQEEDNVETIECYSPKYQELSSIKAKMISFIMNQSQQVADIEYNAYEKAIKHRKKLSDLRNKTEQDLISIDKVKDSNYEEYIDKTKNLFLHISSYMRTFLAELYAEAEFELGMKPPCNYAVIGLGSMALNQMTPYSDLEFAILTENEDYKNNSKTKDYFKNLSHLVHFKTINLGETEIPTSKYELDMSSLLCAAVSLDLGGKTPLGRVDKSKPYELIKTINWMIHYVKNEEDKASHIDKNLPYILEKVCYVYGYENLVTDYQQEVTNFLHSAKDFESQEKLNCQIRALKLLEEGAVEIDYLNSAYDFNASKPFIATSGDLIKLRPNLHNNKKHFLDVKQEIYRLPDRMIYNLGLYFGIEGDSAWDTIDKLYSKRIINLDASENLKKAVSFATTLRLKIYGHNKSQQDDITLFVRNVESTSKLIKHTQNSFHLSEEELIEGGALFQYFYTALPLHKRLEEFCVQHRELNPKARKNFFQDTDFYSDNGLNKGLIYYRLKQYKKAQIKFEEAIKTDSCQNDLSLINILGNIYANFGKIEEAIEQYKNGLIIAEETYGKTHPNVAVFLNNLGLAHDENSQFEEAITFNERSLEIYKNFPSNKLNFKVAINLHHLAVIYDDKGEYEKALKYCKEALVIHEKLYKEEASPNIILSLMCMGDIYYSIGQYNEALRYHNKCWKISKKIYKDEPHPSIGDITTRIANVHYSKGQYTLAIEHLNESLEVYKGIYKDEPHPSTMSILTNLGKVYCAMAHYGKAFGYFTDSLNRGKIIYGDKLTNEVAYVLDNIGALYHTCGQYEMAIKYNYESYQARRKNFKDVPNSKITYSLLNLGNDYQAIGQYSTALKYLHEGLKMCDKLYKISPHPDVSNLLNSVGNIHKAKGEYNEAITYYNRSLNIAENIFKDQPHPYIANTLNNLGTAFESLGLIDQAIEYLNKSLSMSKKLYENSPHIDIARSLNNLGSVHKAKQLYKEAEDYFEQSLSMNRSLHKGDLHPDIALCINNIGTIYRVRGQYDKAIQYHGQSLAISEEIYTNKVHEYIAASLSDLGADYHAKREYNKSLKYYLDSWSINKKIYQELLHPDLAISLTNVGNTYREVNQHNKAVEYNAKGLQMILHFEGHPLTNVIRDNLIQTASNFSTDYFFDKNEGIARKILSLSEKFQDFTNYSLHYEQALDAHMNNGLTDDAIREYKLALIFLPKEEKEMKSKLLNSLSELTGIGYLNLELWLAITTGDAGQLEELADYKTMLNNVPFMDLTPLIYAIIKGDIYLVKVLIKLGIDINEPNDRQCTPLFCSLGTYYGQPMDIEIVDLLLENKADVNQPMDDGDTPIHIAAYKAQPDIIEKLINCKADINAVNKSGNTALHDVIIESPEEIAIEQRLSTVQYLLMKGANFGQHDIHVIFARAIKTLPKCVEYLKAYFTNIEAQDECQQLDNELTNAYPVIHSTNLTGDKIQADH